MRAYYEVRIEHLTGGDRLKVECLGKMPDGSWCNRVALIDATKLLLPGHIKIDHLKSKLRWENCGQRGHVDLSIEWERG